MICTELQMEGILKCYKVKKEKEWNVFDDTLDEDDTIQEFVNL